MKLLQMIFLVLIVSACSSPKPDNFANAKYEFAQFVRMVVHLDDQFIHEAHNYRAENRHLTGDKAQKQKSGNPKALLPTFNVDTTSVALGFPVKTTLF